VVTQTRLHAFDVRSDLRWKVKRSLAVWARPAIRVTTEAKSVTIRLTIEVPSENRRVELEAPKSKRSTAGEVVRLLTSSSPPPIPNVTAVTSSFESSVDPLADDRLRTSRTTAGGLAVAGGLVRAGAYFLPWLVVKGSRVVNLSGSDAGEPILGIGFSMAIVVIGLVYLAGRREASPRLLESLGLGVVIASLINYVLLLDRIESVRSDLLARGLVVTVSAGTGPLVELGGALIALAGGIWAARLARRTSPRRPAPHVPPPPDRAIV